MMAKNKKKTKSPLAAKPIDPASAHTHMEAALRTLSEKLDENTPSEDAPKTKAPETEAPEAEAPEKTVSEKENVKKEPGQMPEKDHALLYGILSRLMDDLGVTNLRDLGDMIDRAETEKLMAESGLDEKSARLFLAQQEKLRAMRNEKRRAACEAVYAEMRRLPFYDDVDEKRDMLDAFILRTGVDPKEAYGALFAEERLRKMQAMLDGKDAEAEKKSKRIPALAGGDAPDKNGYVRLTDAENRIAADAGMTPAEYARYKYAY